MNVYVAGRHRAAVSFIQSELRGAGHSIAYDWTLGFPGERTAKTAQRELDAAANADATVLVCEVREGQHLLGALIEAGAALSHGKPLILYRPQVDSIFWLLPNVYPVESPLGIFMALKKAAA